MGLPLLRKETVTEGRGFLLHFFRASGQLDAEDSYAAVAARGEACWETVTLCLLNLLRSDIYFLRILAFVIVL